MRVHRVSAMLLGGFLAVQAPSLLATAPAVLYSYNVLSLAGESDESYVGQYPGDDLLPYTDDDFEIDVPGGCGNFGGTWGFAHMDHNGDGIIDEGEPIFHTVRADDDDSTLFSALSRPEYGVIYEGEDWAGYWASGSGPNRCNLETAEGYDFEINDWNGWTDESSAFVYNNLGKNQHGLGYAKYRVDYRSVPAEGQDWVYDEIEGWRKTFGFRNNTDDPGTPFDERGACRRWYRPRDEVDLRGYLIPVEDLAGLEDGSLPSLFGWESTDLAAYLRDTVAPLLEHEDFGVWSELIGQGIPAEALLPLTHLYLMQIEMPINVDNGEDICGEGVEQLQGHAGYWGIPPDGSGMFRASSLMGFNGTLIPLLAENLGTTVHEFTTLPEDEARWNLWLQDHFWRDDPTHFGRYELLGGDGEPPGPKEPPDWEIVDDPAATNFDNTTDQALVANVDGAITAPLPRGLSLAEGPVHIVVDVGLNPDQIQDNARIQIIARSGDSVVAYADLDEGLALTANIGGDYDAETGQASNPTASAGDDGPEFGLFVPDDLTAEYTRYVFTIDSDRARVLEVLHGDYQTSSYTELPDLDGEQAIVEGSPDFGDDGITHVTISGQSGMVINTILLFASPGVGPFVRGDCNQDTNVDLSDGVTALGFLFLGSETPGCLAACFASGQGALDLSSAVYIFNFLFSGGPPIPEPTGQPGYSQSAADAAVGCEDYSP